MKEYSWLICVTPSEKLELLAKNLHGLGVDVFGGQGVGSAEVLTFHDTAKKICRIGLKIIGLRMSLPGFKAVLIDKEGNF